MEPTKENLEKGVERNHFLPSLFAFSTLFGRFVLISCLKEPNMSRRQSVVLIIYLTTTALLWSLQEFRDQL